MKGALLNNAHSLLVFNSQARIGFGGRLGAACSSGSRSSTNQKVSGSTQSPSSLGQCECVCMSFWWVG